MLCEKSQMQKTTYCMFHAYELSRKNKPLETDARALSRVIEMLQIWSMVVVAQFH